MAAFIKSLIDFLKAKLFGGIEDGIFVFTDATEALEIKVVSLADVVFVKLSYQDNDDIYTIENQDDVDDIKARINVYLG